MAISGSDGSIILTTKVDESGLSKGLGTLKKGVSAVGKTLLGLGATATTAFVAISKSAVESYAEYEQLAGGVETLFKDSADTLMGYADKAYQTAGLSANEYMATVTSFSASLLQSLGGDTAKAANYADQSIIDMSDNANKMGTSMEMIQNAYQGFAKQNYTMLDNLKLGYGGTKEEMQRLLDDAEKISGIKYDISSFADVTQAIHVIQTELGITGTTAKEASTTIQGSFGMMKSAWQNLLTGMADEEADFDALLKNFIDSVGTVLSNLLPRIQIVADGAFDLVEGLIPQLPALIESLLPAILQGITSIANGILSALPQLIDIVADLVPQMAETLIGMLPQLVETGITLLLSLIDGISQTLPELLPIMVTVIMDIVNILLDNIDVIIETGIQLLVALTEGIMNSLPELVSRMPEIITKIVNTLILLSPQLLSASLRIIMALAEGLIKYVPEMVSRIPTIIKSIANALKQGVSDLKNVGVNLIKGLWNGMSNTKNWLISKIKSLCSNALEAIKNFFGIHSPSRVMNKEIGAMLMRGLAGGITGNERLVTSAMDEISRGIMNTDFSFGSLDNLTLPNIARGVTVPYSSGISNHTTQQGSLNEIKELLLEFTAQRPISGTNSIRIETPIYLDSRQIALAVREAENNLGSQTVFGGFANAY